MPFTPTHAVAAIPLARLRVLMPSALAIGCMLPDLPMFLPGTPTYRVTHAWLQGPIRSMPFGLLAFVLFRLCRGSSISFAPEAVRHRLARYASSDLRMSTGAWLSVVASIALGVWTHIAWDAFTHEHRLGTELVPALANPWLTVGDYALPGYKLLQYGSSVIGLPLLALVIARWYREQASDAPAIEPASFLHRVLAVAIVLGAPAVMLVHGLHRFRFGSLYSAELLAFRVVTRSIGAYLIGAVALTLPQRLYAALASARGRS